MQLKPSIVVALPVADAATLLNALERLTRTTLDADQRYQLNSATRVLCTHEDAGDED